MDAIVTMLNFPNLNSIVVLFPSQTFQWISSNSSAFYPYGLSLWTTEVICVPLSLFYIIWLLASFNISISHLIILPMIFSLFNLYWFYGVCTTNCNVFLLKNVALFTSPRAPVFYLPIPVSKTLYPIGQAGLRIRKKCLFLSRWPPTDRPGGHFGRSNSSLAYALTSKKGCPAPTGRSRPCTRKTKANTKCERVGFGRKEQVAEQWRTVAKIFLKRTTEHILYGRE